MRKLSKACVVSLAINCVLVAVIAAFAWKSGYIPKILPTSASKPVSLYSDNPKYRERTNLFEVYATKHADIVFVGDSITQRCDFSELFGVDSCVNRGVGSDSTEGVLNRIDDIMDLKLKQVFLMIGINDLSQGISADIVTKLL